MKNDSIQQTISLILASVGVATGLSLIWKTIKGFLELRRNNQLLKRFTGPPKHWLFGNMRDFPYGRGLYKGVENTRLYGAAYVIQIGPFAKHLVLTAPEYIQRVLNTAEPKDEMYLILEPWIGDGLLLSKGKKWSRNRRLLTPAFHFDILKPYQNVFSNCAIRMVNKWKEIHGVHQVANVELFEHVSLMTLDSLMKCIFGVDEDFQSRNSKKNPYIESVYTLSELALKRIRFPPHLNDFVYYFSINGYRHRQAVRTAQMYSTNVIEKKRNERKEEQTKTTTSKYLDFLDILLDCRDPDGKGLTDKEIQDEVDTFMFEGHDTTASAISWCLYNLAKYPQYQEKCRREVLAVVGEKDEVSWEDLSKLYYLTMCIKESLRITPPVPIIGRKLTKLLELPNGEVIEAGTVVTLAIYSCHHNPKYWDNPEIFDPERFNIDSMVKKHTHAFIPFSAGPRNCIGQNFAMNELKTCVAMVIKNFRLQVDGAKPADILPELVLRAKQGLWVNLEKIN